MVEEAVSIVLDTPTFLREVDHDHFAPGDQVLVVRGSQDGSLTGDTYTVVASSWHEATGGEGWRLRDEAGGETSFLTAAPKYLIHTDRPCTACVDYFGQLARWVLPVLPRAGVGHTHSYALTDDAQLVHIADEITAAAPHP